MRLLLLAALLLPTSADAQLILTGVVDAALPGGTPKAVELYAAEDVADLSLFAIGSANNGGGSDAAEFTLSGSASAGDFLYVATEADNFAAFFGFAPTFTSNAAAINGNDAIELFRGDEVIDTFGEIDADGEGRPWEYTDGWAYRSDGTGPDGTSFVLDDWSFSGPDALEGAATNADAATAFPIGTFVPDAEAGPRVRFAGSERTVSEDSGETLIALEITDPSDDDATTVTVALGGEARSLDDFEVTPPAEVDPLTAVERITIVFPAGTDAPQTIRVTPNDDRIDELDEALTLTIESVDGPAGARAGEPRTFTLTLRDPDTTPGPAAIAIAAARALADGEPVVVRGVVTRARGDFAYLQDGTGGLALRQPEGSFQDQLASGEIAAGDSIEVAGTLSTFNGLRQLNEDELTSARVIEREVGVPAPAERTLAELASGGEALESQLVRVVGVTFEQTGTFEPRTTYTVSDGTTAFEVRTPNADDTDVDGLSIPTGAVTITAVVGQFDQDGSGDGFQLVPVDATDIGASAPSGNGAVRFAAERATVAEDAGTYTVTVEVVTPPANAGARLNVAVTGGTASADDFSAALPAEGFALEQGASDPVTFEVTLADDQDEEGPETVVFEIGVCTAGETCDGPDVAQPGLFTLTIVDPGSGGDGSVFPGQTGEALQASLRAEYTPSTLGYNRARDEMFSDVWNASGSVPTLYTGRLVSVSPSSSRPRSDAFDQDVNTEHIWPRSQGAADEPAFSNLYNLAPTDVQTNSDRGSLPFGTVSASNAATWYRGSTRQSQTPTGDLSTWSRRSSSRFEPRDAVKGDVARSQFYFYTVYQDRASQSYWNAVRDVLLDWHRQDPVSAEELTRHDRIAAVQGQANPFVLDATLPERAFFDRSTRTRDATDAALTARLFPLPARDALTVSLSRPIAAGTADVVDLLGRTVQRAALRGDRTTVDTAALPAGVYLLRVVGDGATVWRTAFTVAR